MFQKPGSNIYTDESGISFDLKDNGTAEIHRSEDAQGDIFIPSSIEYLNKKYIIAHIESKSFSYCKIKTVSFAKDSLISIIKEDAFQNSTITQITIPSSVTTIGIRCFQGCHNLQSVEFFPDSKLEKIGSQCFSGTSIVTIKIPSNVKCIEQKTFSECKNLKSVEFPPDSKLQTIHELAFECSSIESLTIPASLEQLCTGWCKGIPQMKTFIFTQKSPYFSILNNNFLIGKSNKDGEKFDLLLFVRRDISGDVTIPSNISYIGDYSFESCSQLESIRFESNSFLHINQNCFFNCLSLSEVFFPSCVIEIDEYCFSDCQNLTKVIFSPDLKISKISKGAFSGTGIESISIPPTVMTIDESALKDCSSLKSVEIPLNSKLVSIENSAFESTSIEFLHIPSNLKKIGYNWCFNSPNLKSFSISPENRYFSDIDGQIIIGKSNENDQFYGNFVFAVRTIQDVTIPSYITTLCDSCLSCCSRLKSVTFLPNSELTRIEFATFFRSPIKNLCLPKKFTSLQSHALFGCFKLSTIEFLADSIGIECLDDTPQLLIISAPNAKKINIQKPSGFLSNQFNICSVFVQPFAEITTSQVFICSIS